MKDVLTDENAQIIVEASRPADGTTENSRPAPFRIESMATAKEGTRFRGEDLYDLMQEAKRKGVTVASLLHKLPDANVEIQVSPGPGVVEQAPRKGGRRKGRSPDGE